LAGRRYRNSTKQQLCHTQQFFNSNFTRFFLSPLFIRLHLDGVELCTEQVRSFTEGRHQAAGWPKNRFGKIDL